jgi:hypothetical protein
MPMRSAVMLGLAALVVGAAWALDPPRTAPAPQETQAPAAAQPATPRPATAATVPEAKDAGVKPSDAVPQEEEEKLPPLPPGTKTTGPTPQRFDPSEEVRADFPVSFPVDI